MNSALLLAEPEPSTREFLQRHLADDGFDVLGAEADREALELLARIRAVLRRASPSLRDRLEAGPIAVDLVTRRATVHGRTVALPAKEYDLLAKLATEPERAFTKEQLLREVWGYVALGRTRTLDSHSSRLRRKLRQAGAGPCVVNIWGVGYRLLDPERPPSPALPTGSERTPRPSRDVLQVGVASGE